MYGKIPCTIQWNVVSSEVKYNIRQNTMYDPMECFSSEVRSKTMYGNI